MKEKKHLKLMVIVSLFILILPIKPLISVIKSEAAESGDVNIQLKDIEKRVEQLMKEGDIPGLSLAFVKGDKVYTRGYGYADVEKETPVTSETLFELASASKAFTALAVLRLEQDGLLNLDAPVSKYLPWFYVNFEGQSCPITLRQLLQHTSGIPYNWISYIQPGDEVDALEKTVRGVVGLELKIRPGTGYQYATINYDILGAVIETVSGMKYAEYMTKYVFQPLGLEHTYVGKPIDQSKMAEGYKIGFFTALRYDAPVYKGNEPAGYIISNAEDMGRWLRLQIGLEETPFLHLIRKTQEPNRNVPINRKNLSAYCMGWHSYMNGTDILDHPGNNPNFTAYVGFSPKEKVGVAVLANSNSTATTSIGHAVLAQLRGYGNVPITITPDRLDKGSTVVSVILVLFLLTMAVFLVFLIKGVIKGVRRFEAINIKKIAKWGFILSLFIPFLYGIYLLPQAMGGVSWETALVWGPVSFEVVIYLLLSAFAVSFIMIVVSSIYPQTNKYRKQIPLLLVLSLASGLANTLIIFLITASVFNTNGLFEQLYFFGLAFALYIIGRKILQTRLVKLTLSIVYDLRMKLVEKIFNTSYQKFEKIDRGRVFATLNDDTGQIGNAANIFVMLSTSIITIIGAFIYLATVAFWATALTLGVALTIASVYYVMMRKTRALFEEARDTQNEYLGCLEGMLAGFKELSMHLNKRNEFKKDVEKIVDKFRNKLGHGLINFVNGFLVGETLLITTLATVGFGMRWLFPDISGVVVMGFIMVLLYLIGPFNVLLRSIPEIVRIRVSWGRVQDFSEEVPANIDPSALVLPKKGTEKVDEIKATGVMFKYNTPNENEQFAVGPIDFEAKRGEIVFIVGGNGSGKTTLGKLLTGLYIPDSGSIKINDQPTTNYQLSEYFSVVFSDYHLFEKLYDVDLSGKEADARYYLKLLRLEHKVILEENGFSTVDLSGGQRKRLALLRCYLEDHPIYLFDEIAADQDPEFRKFFYRELLQRMKEKGKIIIAITHDDHYFDAADKVVKMDMGKIKIVDSNYNTTAA